MTRYICSDILLLAIFLSCGVSQAANNMTFSGTLIEPPPCTINAGAVIDVDFGLRVGVTKVNGVNYLKTVGYSIVCDAGANSWEMKLTVSGLPTSYDTAAIETNIAGLGIRLLHDGIPFTLNTPIVVERGHTVVLQAVPVQQPGVTLLEGVFEANATLQADYQ